MSDEIELVRRFAEEGSQSALAELVQLKVNLVYAAALRQTAGDAHLAEEVTQAVFATLARKAGQLKRHAVLTGWLFTTTRFLATRAMRGRQRLQRREQEAYAMNTVNDEAPEPPWDQLRPVIDEALHELAEPDRAVLLLRYFEGRPLAEVGAVVGLEENSARMRVNRALEKLRGRLAQRGITSTVAALGVALASQPQVIAPGSFVSRIAAGAAGAAGPNTFTLMNIITLVTGMVAAGAVALGATNWTLQSQAQIRAAQVDVQHTAIVDGLRADVARLKKDITQLQTATATGEADPALAELRAMVHASQTKLLPYSNSTRLLQLTDGQLAPHVATLFALSAAEKKAVEGALSETSAQLNRLMGANIEGLDQSVPGTATFRLKLYPQEGGKVHDQLIGALQATLGAERYEALTMLMGPNFERSVGGGFGALPRTVQITRLKLNRRLYTVRETLSQLSRFSSPDPSTPPVVLTGSTNSTPLLQADWAKLEQEYPELVKLLPADF